METCAHKSDVVQRGIERRNNISIYKDNLPTLFKNTVYECMDFVKYETYSQTHILSLLMLFVNMRVVVCQTE